MDLSLPDIDSNVTLYPVGVAGEGVIGIGMPTLMYDGVNNEGLIPVYTHDVDIPYCGFSVNINWDANHLQFLGVEAGEFGTIGDESTNSEIRYSYSNGNFKARGIKENAFNFSEQIILFYIKVRIINQPSSDIVLNFNNRSQTDLNYTTLMTWYINPDVSPDPYTYFITPIKNTNGKIIVEPSKSNSESVIGDENHIGAAGSPSGVYVGIAKTPPGNEGVVPVYANSSVNDEFPYNKVICDLEILDTNGIISYINTVGTESFKVTTTYKIVSNIINLHIEAERNIADIDSITFCYIQYRVSDNVSDYKVPIMCYNAELQNTIV